MQIAVRIDRELDGLTESLHGDFGDYIKYGRETGLQNWEGYSSFVFRSEFVGCLETDNLSDGYFNKGASAPETFKYCQSADLGKTHAPAVTARRYKASQVRVASQSTS
jgi:hypothetical protein